MTATEPISILLADDHALVRGALKRRLEDEPDLRVVAAVGTADEALAEAMNRRPSIILMDIDMPGRHCFEAAQAIQSRCPQTRIIFLSAFFNDRYIEQALAVRAWGYIVKNEPEEVLIKAIRKVVSGVTYFSPEVQSRLVIEQGAPRLATSTPARVSTLTDREIEVLRHIARGLSQKEISEVMHISPHTVHRHTASLMQKLDTHDRVALARFAIREGLAEA
jgi:DNA-binding NarL/FixJ family response regulator